MYTIKLKFLVLLSTNIQLLLCQDNATVGTITVDSTTTPIYTWHKKGETTVKHDQTTSPIKPRFATPCTTPNNDMAYCVNINDCPKLLKNLNKKDAQDFILKSSCGPANEDALNPKICCGRYDNYKHLVTENPLPKKCGHQNIVMKGRIYGGEKATLGEFPWMARLIHKNRDGFKSFGCSGFLIQHKFVLTAAHCLDSDNIPLIGQVFEIELGEHNTETVIDCNEKRTKCAEKLQIIRVKDYIVHQKYRKHSKDHHHDIALVHLKKGATLSDYVYPICLQSKIKTPVEYWISGWGKTESREISPIKMKVILPLFDLNDCIEKYNLLDVNVTENQICAGGQKGKDSCSGDSGGPLMVVDDANRWIAAGVVSYGLGCGKEGWPGVYTNIPKYLGWVKKEMLKKASTDLKHNVANKTQKKKINL